eukprot:gene11589-12783_t
MEKKQLLLNGKNIKTLGGDARMDSPGFSAKYGTYSLMDLDSNKVISVNTLQSNEVGGSTHMELAGLKSGLEEMEEHGINFQTIVTDRHGGVKKYTREQKPKKKHCFDVSHVAKSIGKKVEAIGKKKENSRGEKLGTINQTRVYWCACSSDDNAALLKEKWLALFNHIANVHKHKGHELFKECGHETLERAWLKKEASELELYSSASKYSSFMPSLPINNSATSSA